MRRSSDGSTTGANGRSRKLRRELIAASIARSGWTANAPEVLAGGPIRARRLHSTLNSQLGPGVVGGFWRFLRSNRVLMWACIVIAVNQLGFGIVVPVTPLYARTFGVSEAAVGLVVAVYGLGRFLFNLPAGQAADRLG